MRRTEAPINKLSSVIEKMLESEMNCGKGLPPEETKYLRGLRSEGFEGGYRAGLSDAILLINGVEPNSPTWKKYSR